MGILGIQAEDITQESIKDIEGKTFITRFWCKNCTKESDYTFPVGTRISHSRLVGDGTINAIIGNRWIEIRCKICEIGSLF